MAGTRPKGIYTAGQMQEMMNLYGYVPEGPVVILGSGDLGLIMAEQIARCGCAVTLIEQKASCGGMARNQRCLSKYPITLLCGTTLTEVLGDHTITGVVTADGLHIPCRTLLVAVGLRPEREVIYGIEDQPWLHVCGNCRTVHPMVESVVNEGYQAGLAAYQHLYNRIDPE